MAKKRERIKPKNPVFEELSDHAYNALSMSAIDTIDQLADHYGDDKKGGIRSYRTIGRMTYNELTEFLKKHGRTWKQREKKK